MSIDISRHQLSSLVLAGAAAVIVSLAPATGSAHGKGGGKGHGNGPGKSHACHKVKGDWSSEAVPVPPCTSPIGICTSGELKGSLKGGTYAFTMNSMTPVPEPDAPFVTFFSGISFVTLRNGHVIRGVDTGAMNVNPPGFFGSGKFTTLLSFVEGGTGYLQIRGTLNFITGAASGDYQGELCPE